MVENIIEILNTCLNQVEDREAFSYDYKASSENHELYGLLKEPLDQSTTRAIITYSLITKTIEYIGKDVLFNGEVVKLSWRHVAAYLDSKMPDRKDLVGYIDEVFASKTYIVRGNGNLCSIVFKPEQEQEQIAVAYVDFLNTILPVGHAEYPKVINKEAVLWHFQDNYCERYVVDLKGNNYLRDFRYINNGDMLLKSLRADEFDFSYKFILGIIPGDNNSRRLHNLRYVDRKAYTITPKGHIARRVNKQPAYTTEEKQGFSQIQSCTLIDEKALSPAFGFSKERTSKLYGLMTHTSDALISRLLVNDSGTVTRIFDHSDEQNAKSSPAYTAYQENSFYTEDKIDYFREKNEEIRPASTRTNEVLARLRFNPCRSVVSICSDTLEARLLAYDFAQELLEHYRVYVESNGARLNPHFKIPIIFYTKKTKKANADPLCQLGHEIKIYTDEMRKNDQEHALKIYNSDTLRSKRYGRRDYEFLLGLPETALRYALFHCSCGEACYKSDHRPLALVMIESGYSRMLSRLLRATRNGVPNTNGDVKHNLRDELVDFLVKNNFLQKNDLTISRLILAEEFEFADKFIAATQTDKYQLTIDNALLVSTLIDRGNPRHFNYMGLEKMLILAAQHNSWVVITLCLKEYPNLSKILLGELLVFAGKRVELAVVDRLLKMGANTIPKDDMAPMSHAAFNYDWSLVGLFANHLTDAEDKSEYGFALVAVLRQGLPGLAKLILQAGAKPTWRGQGHQQYQLQSTLYFAIAHGFNDLLSPLIEHEKQYQDDYSSARHGLALSLAYLQGNQQAIKLLEANFASTVLIDPVNIAASICQRVLEAFAVFNEQLAEHSLLRYCYQYRLLTQPYKRVAELERSLMSLFNLKSVDVNRCQFVDGLRIIMPNFYAAFKSLPSIKGYFWFEKFIEWLLLKKEPSLFGHLTNLSCLDDETAKNEVVEVVVKTILQELSFDTRNLIKKVVNHYFSESPWNKTWQAKLDKEFDNALRHRQRSAAGIVLLYEFGPALPEDLLASFFNDTISENRLEITKAIMNDPGYCDEAKEKLLREAIWRENLSDNNIVSLIKCDFNVTPEMLRFSAVHGRTDLLLYLLDLIKINKYSKLDYQWCYFSAFHYFLFENLKVAKKLMSLLGPSQIRYFLLIDLLLLFGESKALENNKAWPLINRMYDHYHGDFCNYVYENFNQSSEYNLKILRVLDDYFVDVNTLPKESVTQDTYKTILGNFEKILKENSPDILLSKQSNYPKVDFKVVYQYMKLLDELLSQCEEELKKNEGDSQPLLEDLSWAKDTGLLPAQCSYIV